MRTNKISTVIGGLRIALQTIANKIGVTLTIGGDTACTNGSVITLPDLPGEEGEAALLARGYIDHEAAHVRFTDFGISPRAWVNLIEDVRVEREQGREYPGCAVNLRQLALHLRDRGHFRGNRQNPLSLLMSWACCRGRSVVLGQPLGEIAAEMEQTCRNLFGDLFCDTFAGLANEIGACRSTADSDDLARRIEALIQNPPQPSPGQVSGEGEGSPSCPDPKGGNPRSANEPEPDPDKAGAVNSNPSVEGNDTEDGGAGKGGGTPSPRQQQRALRQAATADAELASKEMNVGELLKEALRSEHNQAARTGTLEVIPQTHHLAGASSTAGDQRQAERRLGFDHARRQTAQMRARLAGLFQSVRLQRSGPKQVGQCIDRGAGHRIASMTPDFRIFTSRRERQDQNTAVVILGDRSGSMVRDKIQIALQAAFVTAEALELLAGVACAVGFFPWGKKVVQLKDFGEKPKASRFAIKADGGTPMGGALLWAGMQLCHRPEPRKMVVVMTDGQPDDIQTTLKAMGRLSLAGIETYGIGILDGHILQWMPKGARTISRIEELPKALVDLLRTALLEGGQAR